jgi:cytosine/creatinine deaminase
MVNQTRKTPFYIKLEEHISSLGGMFNAHLHLDRAGTLDERFFEEVNEDIVNNSYISLHEKHHLIKNIHHSSAYAKEALKSRVNDYLDMMIDCNTFRADTLVDVTADNVELSALEVLQQLKEDRANEIDLRIGAYSPLGFIDSEPQRWDVFLKGAEQADFIAALPEADDKNEYPDHIGFMEHCRRMLELAKESNMMLHVHTDQRNEPAECGTEQLIEAVKEFGGPESSSGEPMIWAVHMISPSTYNEPRFKALVQDLLECNIGVICCPSAAIGMRQLRPIKTPTYNSIPRVLELIAEGVHVRLASDNIADICSPTTTADLIDEVFILSAALRFYHVDTLAKLAAGKALNEQERGFIKEHLAHNQQEIDKVLSDSVKKVG